MSTAVTTPARRSRWQFSLRRALAWMVIAGAGAAAVMWWIKPRDVIHIHLAADQQVWVVGRQVPWDDVSAAVREQIHSARNHGHTLFDLRVQLQVAGDVRYENLLAVIIACHEQSLENYRLDDGARVHSLRLPRYLLKADVQDGWVPIRLEADTSGGLARVHWLNDPLQPLNTPADFSRTMQELSRAGIYDSLVIGLEADPHLACRHLFETLESMSFEVPAADGTPRHRQPFVWLLGIDELRESMASDGDDDPADLGEPWSESEWSTPAR